MLVTICYTGVYNVPTPAVAVCKINLFVFFLVSTY